MSTENLDDYQASAPFEGPEKLLEVWFAPSPSQTPIINGKHGLRAVPRQTWEDMLDIVKCKVLSVIEGIEMDAYLLRLVLGIFFLLYYQPYHPFFII